MTTYIVRAHAPGLGKAVTVTDSLDEVSRTVRQWLSVTSYVEITANNDEDFLADAEIEQPPLVTRTGKVLTDADIEALADEAEAGYDLDRITVRRTDRLPPTTTDTDTDTTKET